MFIQLKNALRIEIPIKERMNINEKHVLPDNERIF